MRRGSPLVLLLAVTVAGCGAQGPPTILYGEDVCDRCRMVISEARYAGAARGPGGDEARFDDIGCLAAQLPVSGGDWSVWVHDSESGEWLRAEDAAFRRAQGVSTPMGSGWVAAARTASVASGDETRSWEELLAGGLDAPLDR